MQKKKIIQSQTNNHGLRMKIQNKNIFFPPILILANYNKGLFFGEFKTSRNKFLFVSIIALYLLIIENKAEKVFEF